MKKIDETTFAPGLVLMICKAGRMVLAVECTAPAVHLGERQHCRTPPDIVIEEIRGVLGSKALVFAHLDKGVRHSSLE
jgi:hypothetical protein